MKRYWKEGPLYRAVLSADRFYTKIISVNTSPDSYSVIIGVHNSRILSTHLTNPSIKDISEDEFLEAYTNAVRQQIQMIEA